MTTQNITHSLIQKLKPATKAYDVRDAKLKGFLIRVYPSGSMAYCVQYARNKRTTLGKVEVLTPRQAREKAIKILADFANGIDHNQVKKDTIVIPTLGQFYKQDYLPWYRSHHSSVSSLESRFKCYLSKFERKLLSEITPREVEQWRARLTQHLKPNSINKIINSLQSILNRAVDWGLINENPIKHVKKLKYDDARVRFLSQEEEKNLFEQLLQREADAQARRKRYNHWRTTRGKTALPEIAEFSFCDHLFPLVIVAINTGLRWGELSTLKKEQINLERNHLWQLGKNKKIRYIPINEITQRTLKQWLSQTQSTYVFPSPCNPNKPITMVKSSWSKLLDDAGIEKFHWHDLRHHFASKLVMSGVDINTVRELLGHADIKMTLRYTHLAPNHMENAVGKLNFKHLNLERIAG